MANKEFILGDGENGVVKKTINFPADNSLSIADIVSILEKITEEEKMTFRFNISVDFILQNIQTGDYRYFIPDRNETLFPKPILIGSLEGVDKNEWEIRQHEPLWTSYATATQQQVEIGVCYQH